MYPNSPDLTRDMSGRSDFKRPDDFSRDSVNRGDFRRSDDFSRDPGNRSDLRRPDGESMPSISQDSRRALPQLYPEGNIKGNLVLYEILENIF